MGIIQNIKLQRYAIQISEMFRDLDIHFKKSCAYCGMDFGLGQDVQVYDVVLHYETEHPGKIEESKIKKFKELCLKVS